MFVTDMKPNPTKAWLMALIAWLIPGSGHAGQGRILRGALGGASVLAIFPCGVALGGHIYGLRDTSEGLLSSLFGFCDLGSGILWLGSRALGLAVSERPQLSTSEYGNVFLMVAGLLNFILALDAFDIGVGRKS
ncbi:MAG: hypothetical protein DMF67_00575 [Acidobacteria bacterium]|nr:MAG: hypothetical protein DMF67_00575 [Acidobacteriota bacterium]